MDAATPLVSVIMSVRNGEQWLKEAIESILHQSYTHWEFIIIDDASGEPAQQILQQYKTDTRIKIIRKDTQQGLTKNLNTAIDHCKGDFIARMDADDNSKPKRLEKQVAYLQENTEVAVVAGLVVLIDEKGKITGNWGDDWKTITPASIKNMLPRRNCIAHPSVLMRAEILKQYRYNEAQLHSQDWDLWLRLSNDGKVIDKVKEPILSYRLHANSVTSTSNKKSVFLKKHEFYTNYLKDSRSSWFNSKVRLSFQLNRIKLFLSNIKRSLTS
ncbi:MAG: glycosyltransferase family 2 protein [Chitinophagaceae bacterium]